MRKSLLVLVIVDDQRADERDDLLALAHLLLRRKICALGEDRQPFIFDLVRALDTVGDDLGHVGVDDLLHLEREDRHDEAQKQKADQSDDEPQHQGRSGHGEKADSAGAAGGDFVVAGEPAIDHRRREKCRDRQ